MNGDTFPVVHAVTPGPVGGLESVVAHLAAGQQEAGWRTTVVSVVERDDPALPFHRALRDARVEVRVLASPGRLYWREVRLLASAFAELQPAVVHTHGYRSDVLAGQAARRLGLPTVSTAHGFTGGDWKNRFYEWLQLRAWRGCSGVVAVSTPLFEQLSRAGISPGRLHRIPNAWAPAGPTLDRSTARRELGLQPSDLVLGWVGRLTREKGADLLLEGVARLRHASLRISLLGAGREEAQLRARVAALGLEGMVRFHGVVPSAYRFYSAFDVFVLSSRTEGTPICLFEAMAAEVPIVATRVGGVPDVVGAGEAVLVESGDTGGLAEAIHQVLADPGGARRRALAARARLEQEFAPGPWVDRYLRLYATLQTPNRQRAVP